MTPAASCPIMTGGRRRPVLPSMPWTSLPQCAAGLHGDEDIVWGTALGEGDLPVLEILVVCKDKGFHHAEP